MQYTAEGSFFISIIWATVQNRGCSVKFGPFGLTMVCLVGCCGSAATVTWLSALLQQLQLLRQLLASSFLCLLVPWTVAIVLTVATEEIATVVNTVATLVTPPISSYCVLGLLLYSSVSCAFFLGFSA